jgi:hypothetical protein
LKRLCNAANLPEAHILAGVLAQRGIRVRILNANASGAIGEIPVDAAAPQLWLEDARDEERARAVLHEFHSASSGPAKRCAACGEENPPAFDLCWSCGRSLPG